MRPPVRLPLRNPFTWAVEKKEWNGEPYLGDIRGGRPHGLGVTYGPDNRQMVSVWQMGSISRRWQAGQVESATLNATREYVDLMLRDWIIGFGKFMPRDFEIKDGKFKTQTPEKTKTHGRTRFRSIRTIKIVPFICALGAV